MHGHDLAGLWFVVAVVSASAGVTLLAWNDQKMRTSGSIVPPGAPNPPVITTDDEERDP